MRVELRDGQWAELRERITHATAKELRKLVLRSGTDDGAALDLDTAITRAFVTSWHVLDPEGAVIPLDDADAIERAPEDIIDELSTVAAKLWTKASDLGAADPNASTPPSSDA